MIDAVTFAPDAHLATPAERRHVLVTGSAGNIGSYFAEHNHDRYQLRLHVRPGDPSKRQELQQWGELVEADLGDLAGLKRCCEGIDTVVHMAGDPSPGDTWHHLLDANIIGTYNLFAAALHCKCRRVIHASSIHAVSGYPADVQVKPSDPVNPGDLYGVTKCFGEALARYVAEQEGMSAICLRIGGFQPLESASQPKGISNLDAFVSKRDLNQLIQRCVDVVGIQFAIFNGVSNNRFKRLDISNAREALGYAPQDDTTELHPQLQPLHLNQKVSSHSTADPGAKSGMREEV